MEARQTSFRNSSNENEIKWSNKRKCANQIDSTFINFLYKVYQLLSCVYLINYTFKPINLSLKLINLVIFVNMCEERVFHFKRDTKFEGLT